MSYYIESLIYALMLLLGPGGIIFLILVFFATYLKHKKDRIKQMENEKERKKEVLKSVIAIVIAIPFVLLMIGIVIGCISIVASPISYM